MWKTGYELPREVYMQTLWFIRTYPLMVEEREALIGKAPVMDGQPHGTTPGDPTGHIAVKRAELSLKIEAVDDALEAIPAEYRRSIMDNIVLRVPYHDYAARNTWKTWRRRFIFYVAKNMRFY